MVSLHQQTQCAAREVLCSSWNRRVFSFKIENINSENFLIGPKSKYVLQFFIKPVFYCSCFSCQLSFCDFIISRNRTSLTASIDLGSFESNINSNTTKRLKLDEHPYLPIQMASSAVKIKSTGFCLTHINQ